MGSKAKFDHFKSILLIWDEFRSLRKKVDRNCILKNETPRVEDEVSGFSRKQWKRNQGKVKESLGNGIGNEMGKGSKLKIDHKNRISIFRAVNNFLIAIPFFNLFCMLFCLCNYIDIRKSVVTAVHVSFKTCDCFYVPIENSPKHIVNEDICNNH